MKARTRVRPRGGGHGPAGREDARLRHDPRNVEWRQALKIKWVTREKTRLDRIACPWGIRRFIDREPIFLFAASDAVLDVGA